MTVVAIGTVTTGLMGFLVVLALCVACVFLFRSMAKHLRKVPRSFDDPANNRDEPAPPTSPNGPRPK